MTKNTEITPSNLHRLLRCDAEAGKLYWRTRTPDMFSDRGNVTAKARCKTWNTRYANKEAVAAVSGNGYKRGRILVRSYCAHRVIWAMHYGEWPEDQIDHINHIRDDNRIENLRDVTGFENAQNAPIRKDNISGVCGVLWCKPSSKWLAKIRANNEEIYLGLFTCFSKAVKARKNAELKYGFHKNHGKTKPAD